MCGVYVVVKSHSHEKTPAFQSQPKEKLNPSLITDTDEKSVSPSITIINKLHINFPNNV